MSEKKEILSCVNLQKTYYMGTEKLEVLKGIDLSIKAGEYVAVVGASGSGKSTLLHLLGGLDKCDAGEVFFEQAKLAKMRRGRLNRFRNRKVGFVFQFYHLFEEMNVLENIMLPAMAQNSLLGWLGSRKTAKNLAKQLCLRLGLENRAGHKPAQLSGGERQRVAIGRAMMNSPALILADEPTGNLDSATGDGILSIFDEIHSTGQTIVMVTHDQRVAEKADRVLQIVDGRIEAA